jgi:hypothetical protein
MIHKTRRSSLAAIAAAGLVLASGAVSAAPIMSYTISAAGTQSNLATPRGAEADFLASLDGAVTETFEGFAVGLQAPSINTLVGAFAMTTAGTGGACGTTCSDGVKILSATTSPFSGRFNTTISGTKWLDSFDARTFTMTPKAGINSIGFYITDPNDSGGRFSFTLGSGDVEVDFGSVFGSSLSNGRGFYLTFSSSEDITGLTIFANNSNDGFGIDDVTVGRLAIGVPEPGSLALLGLGLLGMGLARRRRLG